MILGALASCLFLLIIYFLYLIIINRNLIPYFGKQLWFQEDGGPVVIIIGLGIPLVLGYVFAVAATAAACGTVGAFFFLWMQMGLGILLTIIGMAICAGVLIVLIGLGSGLLTVVTDSSPTLSKTIQNNPNTIINSAIALAALVLIALGAWIGSWPTDCEAPTTEQQEQTDTDTIWIPVEYEKLKE